MAVRQLFILMIYCTSHCDANGQATGTLETIAGGGSTWFVAGSAVIKNPSAIAIDSLRNVYLVESSGHRIGKIYLNGTMLTLAGTGVDGYSGDGGPATAAKLNTPQGVAVDNLGNVFIADTFNHRIRKVFPNGMIVTLAGTGTIGYSGDGGPATAA